MGSLRQTQFSSSQFCHRLLLLLAAPLSCGVAAADTILLQSVLSWTSSFVIPMALMSRLTQSIHLWFGLPLLLLPGGTISRVFLPTYSWSRLFACPNQPSLASLHLSVIYVLPSVSTCSLWISILLPYAFSR